MVKFALILLILPTLAFAESSFHRYQRLFHSSQANAPHDIVSEADDPELISSVDERAEEQREATIERDQMRNEDCNGRHTYPLSETVLKLVQDVEAIVTDEMMEEIDAPQTVVNQAIAKSKDLVCAQMMMFAKTHNLNIDINCMIRPHKIPPIHFQVIKFPGLVEYKEEIEKEIELVKARLAENPKDFSADTKLRKLNREFHCLTENRINEDFNCFYLMETQFKRGGSVVQIEMQDKSGKWYEFNRLPIDYFSGAPGPKTKEGDKQVPESRFKLTNVNPASNYFSAVHINYEGWNSRSDLLGDLNTTGSKGGQIKMHGHGGSVGCLDMGNRGAPWVSALVDMSLKRNKIPEIDIYPTEMESVDKLSEWPGYEKFGEFWDKVKTRYWDKHGAGVNRSLKRVDEMMSEIRKEE
jgi:hypothetical protein